ncbi:integrin alpha-6-like [Echeneis naucrates]|uniref:integrin alpha-6-like n=1 Tax=Echeneis naucrates TaxID=173247 RepID=UPI0011140A5A|nr:integrin alpha-6-like [Echeneis naucrates]
MEDRITCGLWLLAFLLGCARVSAFNLDTDNVLKKRGEPGSLFGFSMAMHRQLEPVDKRMLLVGAPRAAALQGQVAKVTGGLYNCDMGSNSDFCTRVNFDNEENTNVESKENQWMGVTVNSQGPGGKIVTCAHRYQRRSNVNTPIESRDIIGRCYVLSQNLVIDPSAAEDGGGWHFCDSRPRGHEMFGSCQQGLSATFDREYHYLIFGAPGAYNWKGVVRLEQKNDTFLEMGIYDDGPFEAGDEREKNPDLVPASPNSYLGFSLDSGKSLVNKSELTVVAGAPRANHSGAVVLLKLGPPSSNILLQQYTLEGEGLASSFGYDLAVLDLNGDGWQDIVVGAPQYFEKDGEIGGAVYVYVNKAGNWNKVKPTRIDGAKDSMFGLAVENMGDSNLDGYDDFAVGAPYDNEGAGAVYIYSGSATGLSSKKAPEVKMFGYSLAGNMDLDKNAYPDLAVGSLSDSVFVYKTRPVVKIQKEIKFSPKEIDLTKKNCGNAFCLDIDVCFSYTANPKSYAPRLTVAYSIEADGDKKKNGLHPRATFIDSSGSENSYESKGVLNINSKATKQCIKRKLMIKENIRDKLHGIPIDVSVDIQDAKRKRRQSSDQLAPVMDSNEAAITRSEVQFLKEGCGGDNVCQSNLQVKYRYGQRGTNEDAFVPLKMENNVPVISLSEQKDIALEVKVTNANGDDAHEASLVVSFPPSLTYSAFRVAPSDRQVTCEANKDGSKADCELGNPFKRDAEVTFYIIMGTGRISLNITELEIDLQFETTSQQKKIAPVRAKAKVAIVLQLSVSGLVQPSQAYFSGVVKGEAAMKAESEIGSAITHQFRIINLGRSLTDFGTATLTIHWPHQTAQGKWLLYLVKITATGVEKMACTPKDQINPNRMELSNARRKRAATDTQGSEEGTISRYTDKKSASLSCDSGAKCIIINCPLRGLDSNAVFTLHSRLWNGTFIEDYSKLHHVDLTVKASLKIDSTRNTVLQNAESHVKLTVFPERRAAQQAGVPWWIIVLSILFGLLLLALLAFLLWKCGFFKRAKYEERVPSYNAVRIKRGEREINPGNGKWESQEKKSWMTTWHDNEHYS